MVAWLTTFSISRSATVDGSLAANSVSLGVWNSPTAWKKKGSSGQPGHSPAPHEASGVPLTLAVRPAIQMPSGVASRPAMGSWPSDPGPP